MQIKWIIIGLGVTTLLTACGSGGSTSGSSAVASVNNVMPVYMDSGYNGQGEDNRIYATVHLCQPGSTVNCQDIDHVIVDTGSTGLRIFESFIPASMNLPAVLASDGNNNPLTQCMFFGSGVDYGSLHYADLYLAGESAPNVQVQIMNDPLYTIYPSGSTGCPVATKYSPQPGAKGVLGIGAKLTTNQSNLYSCATPQTCQLTTNNYKYPFNPIAQFVSNDNNGVMVNIGQVPTAGTQTINGQLIFGLGTQPNNQLPSTATLLYSNESVLNCEFSLNYNGNSYLAMFDTGTPFTSATLADVASCTSYPYFYCPENGFNFTATLYSYNDPSSPNLQFNSPVGNYQAYVDNQSAPTTILPGFIHVPNQATNNLIIGMSQLYGKTIYLAIDHQSTPYGTGPFWTIQDNNN